MRELARHALGVPYKLGAMAQAYNPSTQKVSTVESEVQIHSWLHSKFKASLNYYYIVTEYITIYCLKNIYLFVSLEVSYSHSVGYNLSQVLRKKSIDWYQSFCYL